MVAGGGLPSPRARSAIGSAHARDRRDENPEGVESAHGWNPGEKASTILESRRRIWWLEADSNRRPRNYETLALTT